jgi:very-short-patch-repair endonuclease
VNPGKDYRTPPDTLAHAREHRRYLTHTERELWYRLRNGYLCGLKFRRQYPIGPFIADFYCAAHRLVVEVDGYTHDYKVDHDRRRTKWLQDNGYRVVRFSDQDVSRDVESVLLTILAECEQPTLTPVPSPSEGEVDCSQINPSDSEKPQYCSSTCTTIETIPSPFQGEGQGEGEDP